MQKKWAVFFLGKIIQLKCKAYFYAVLDKSNPFLGCFAVALRFTKPFHVKCNIYVGMNYSKKVKEPKVKAEVSLLFPNPPLKSK